MEVLLLTRPANSTFAPRAEVFPGGSVDVTDLDPGWAELGTEVDSNPEFERHLLVAAVRETFEECGVLLVRDKSGHPCPPKLVAQLASLRRRSQAGAPERFLVSLTEAGVRPGWEDLVFCAHWVTPEGLPRIFDTRFFAAALPQGQEPSLDTPGEVESLRWSRPSAALGEAYRGQTQILPPTRAVLELLETHSTVAQALGAIRGSRIERVQPKLEEVTSARYPGLDPEAILDRKGEGDS